MKQRFYLGILTAMAASTMGIAYSSKKAKENDSLMIATAAINLTQAINVAEHYVGGRAVHADYERKSGRWGFDVAVVRENRVFNIKVDATSGKVILTESDKIDWGETPINSVK